MSSVMLNGFEFDLDAPPKRESIDERRTNIAKELSHYLDDPNSVWATKLREQAEWTQEQWDKHDAEIEARWRAGQEAKERERRKHHFSALAKAGWPKRALTAAQNADLEHPAIKRVAEWLKEDRTILVLAGVAGCGKTVASARWALEDRLGHHTAFVRASTFARSSRFDSDTRNHWLRAYALALDDLGAEYVDAKGSLLTDLDELVDQFYGDCKRLLITTNLTPAQFRGRYGERVADRLRECGSWFSIASGSLRGKP